MKTSLYNGAIGEAITQSGFTIDGDYPLSNITDPISIKSVRTTAGTTGTFTVTFATTKTVSFLGLFNLSDASGVAGAHNITAIDAVFKDSGGATIYTAADIEATINGLDRLSACANIPDGIAGVKSIDTTITISTGLLEIGLLWVNTNSNYYVDLYTPESIKPVDISDDTCNISRADTPQTRISYRYQSFDITIGKLKGWRDVRETMRKILRAGYSFPRPWIFEEADLGVLETIYAIMDSGKVQYEIKGGDADGEFLAQNTIGLREVF